VNLSVQDGLLMVIDKQFLTVGYTVCLWRDTHLLVSRV